MQATAATEEEDKTEQSCTGREKRSKN